MSDQVSLTSPQKRELTHRYHMHLLGGLVSINMWPGRRVVCRRLRKLGLLNGGLSLTGRGIEVARQWPVPLWIRARQQHDFSHGSWGITFSRASQHWKRENGFEMWPAR